jgi:DnaJ-class molecular chaperone
MRSPQLDDRARVIPNYPKYKLFAQSERHWGLSPVESLKKKKIRCGFNRHKPYAENHSSDIFFYVSFDPYRILDLDSSASLEQIRQAYHGLARQYHPDVNTNNEAEDYFKLVDYAYSILIDPEKRDLYDEYGDAALRYNFNAAKLRMQQAKRFPRDSDGLSTYLGGARRTQRSAKVGPADLVIPVKLDAKKAASGGTMRFASPVGGAILMVRIPKGVETGTVIRLVGKGRAGGRGNRPGDLYLELTVEQPADVAAPAAEETSEPPKPSERLNKVEVEVQLPEQAEMEQQKGSAEE